MIFPARPTLQKSWRLALGSLGCLQVFMPDTAFRKTTFGEAEGHVSDRGCVCHGVGAGYPGGAAALGGHGGGGGRSNTSATPTGTYEDHGDRE